ERRLVLPTEDMGHPAREAAEGLPRRVDHPPCTAGRRVLGLGDIATVRVPRFGRRGLGRSHSFLSSFGKNPPGWLGGTPSLAGTWDANELPMPEGGGNVRGQAPFVKRFRCLLPLLFTARIHPWRRYAPCLPDQRYGL